MVHVLLLLLALSLSLGACQQREEKASSGAVTSEEVQRKVTDAMETAADYAKQEKDEYVAKVQKEMDETRRDIERLKSKGKTASAKTKAEIDRDIRAAEAKWNVAEEKLQQVKAASAESWKNLRSGMDKAVDDVKRFFSPNKKG